MPLSHTEPSKHLVARIHTFSMLQILTSVLVQGTFPLRKKAHDFRMVSPGVICTSRGTELTYPGHCVWLRSFFSSSQDLIEKGRNPTIPFAGTPSVT